MCTKGRFYSLGLCYEYCAEGWEAGTISVFLWVGDGVKWMGLVARRWQTSALRKDAPRAGRRQSKTSLPSYLSISISMYTYLI